MGWRWFGGGIAQLVFVCEGAVGGRGGGIRRVGVQKALLLTLDMKEGRGCTCVVETHTIVREGGGGGDGDDPKDPRLAFGCEGGSTVAQMNVCT